MILSIVGIIVLLLVILCVFLYFRLFQSEKYYRYIARKKLIHRYEYLNEVNKLMEEYLTDRIMAGGSADFLGKSRNDLVTKQNEIKETAKMAQFLKNRK